MQELLQNQTIQVLLSFLSGFGGTLVSLALFLYKLVKTTRETKSLAAGFENAARLLTDKETENETLRKEIAAMQNDLAVIRRRQEIAYCNTPELVRSGYAKKIMEVGDESGNQTESVEPCQADRP